MKRFRALKNKMFHGLYLFTQNIADMFADRVQSDVAYDSLIDRYVVSVPAIRPKLDVFRPDPRTYMYHDGFDDDDDDDDLYADYSIIRADEASEEWDRRQLDNEKHAMYVDCSSIPFSYDDDDDTIIDIEVLTKEVKDVKEIDDEEEIVSFEKPMMVEYDKDVHVWTTHFPNNDGVGRNITGPVQQNILEGPKGTEDNTVRHES